MTTRGTIPVSPPSPFRDNPFQVDVCVCTFRRDHIGETLRSLAAMTAAPAFRVIVADNDDNPSARALVQRTAAETGLAVTYVHAPARNISIARNACLDAAESEFIAFIDDDERSAPGWLAALFDGLRAEVDVVLGPVSAVYAGNCPAWIRKADPHSARPVCIDGQIRTGYTSNVLFRRTATCFDGLRFREELGRSGGEDTAFFTAAHKAGARFAFSPGAIVTEDVPPTRATFKWLFHRRFRAGQTHGRLLRETGEGGDGKIAAVAAAKALLCLGAALLPSGKSGHLRQCLLRGALHAGVVARVLGKRDLEQYGHG